MRYMMGKKIEEIYQKRNECCKVEYYSKQCLKKKTR